ncbi:hypothetical protein DL95DRAFT_511998, partial [Leptodontidium sp. 2 PMI_412]
KEVYIATITDLLKTYNAYPVSPYNYSFLVNFTKEFFELANIITSVSISTTIRLSKRLAITDLLLI